MFVLIDYIQHRLKVGKHSVASKRGRHPINLSWEGSYEPIIEGLLKSGDAIFFSNDNSYISWLVQYLTKTDISHVGIYIGDGKVFHATLSGTRIDQLSTFFGEGCHIIPVSMQSLHERPSQADPDSMYFFNISLSNFGSFRLLSKESIQLSCFRSRRGFLLLTKRV